MNARLLKFKVEKRDGPKCFWRGEGCLDKATDLHHIVPRSNPFDDLWHLKNLCLLCRHCHEQAQSAQVRADLLARMEYLHGYDYSMEPFKSALVPLNRADWLSA